MSQISPVYKRKVMKENFKELVKNNTVLKQVKKSYLESRLSGIKNGRIKEDLKRKWKDKVITSLVQRLQSIFTSPDNVYMLQEA